MTKDREFYRTIFKIAIPSAFQSLITFLVVKGPSVRQQPKRLLAPALCLATCLGSNLLITIYIAERLPAVVQNPITCGLSNLVSILIGWVFYKERLPLRGYVAMAFGIAGIVLLSL